MKLALLAVSSITAGGLISNLAGYTDDAIMVTISSVLSVILGSVINLADFHSIADSHKRSSDELWKIREDYRSLIVDFDSLSESERISRRDSLSERTGAVYSKAPPTGRIACFLAKRALDKGEQEITPQERDDFLRS